MVASFIKDERLRQAFSFHTLLVGGSPFSTSSIYTLIHALEREWGVLFPLGGTGALVRGLVRLFEDLGGEVRLNSPVEQITVSGRRANGVTAKGETQSFDLVASNGDLVHTYGKLLSSSPRGRKEATRLASRSFSMSLFVIYFGVRKTYPDVPHHTVLFGPRYRELIKEIFRGAELPDDFSLYLHNPCVTDPSLAPPGCSAFYVLSPVPHLGKAPLDWEVEGPRYRDRILDELDRRHLPGLRDNLETVRIFTPADFAQTLNAHVGSAFSLEPVLWQSAWFRAHNRDDQIRNLYFVGAGTHPGAGVPGVIASAKATAGLMLADAFGSALDAAQ
jgi:phytoene desaturase